MACLAGTGTRWPLSVTGTSTGFPGSCGPSCNGMRQGASNFSVRFGPPGPPDREALEGLIELGEGFKPVPVNRNQMIRLAVREYVERHSGGGGALPANARKARTAKVK